MNNIINTIQNIIQQLFFFFFFLSDNQIVDLYLSYKYMRWLATLYIFV